LSFLGAEALAGADADEVRLVGAMLGFLRLGVSEG
jgi:hypothetical protein